MKLVIYTRTSTANGSGSDSLEAQAEVCAAWATEHGHKVVGVHRDEALSGGLPANERPGLQAALLELQAGTADGLIVHRLDRLARELTVQEAALAVAWASGPRVAVIEAVEGEILRDDPNDPMRSGLRKIAGVIAEIERNMIRARLQGGRRRKAAKGGYIGGPMVPYGSRLVDGAFEPIAAERLVIDRIVELRDGGAAWRAVADALNARGVAPPSGAAWYPMTTRRIYLAAVERRAAAS